MVIANSQACHCAMLTIFIILLAAHSFGDFLLQTNTMARKKCMGHVLLVHAVLHGGLVYLLLQQWRSWEVPVAVAAVHFGIDFIKIRKTASAKAFAGDQATHVLVLAAIAPVAVYLGWCVPFTGYGWTWLVGLAGFVAVVQGVGFFVGAVTDRCTLPCNLNTEH